MADIKTNQERDELFRRIYKIATDLVHAGHVAEWDFELFASYGIQTNSNPYGGRQRTPKSPQLLIILKLMC